jgi:GT2 family glycosyltransferase
VASSSVIVVSYRPGDWLRPCVESVTGQADEVVVVDNASAGGEASAVARECGARSVRNPRNLGFAGGVAAGLAEAGGDLIAVLNDDAVACPGWLASAANLLADAGVAAVTPKVIMAGLYAEVALADEVWFAPGDARPLGRQVRSVTVDGREVLAACVGAGLHDTESGPDGGVWRWTTGAGPFYVPVGGAGEAARPAAAAPPAAAPPAAAPPAAARPAAAAGPAAAAVAVAVDGEPVTPGPVVRVLNHAGSYLRAHGVAGEYGLGAPDDGRFDIAHEPFGFSGTAPVFRASTLRRLGSFATPFFAYNEDTDWCLRARLAGLRIAYDPAATVEHRLSATSGGTAAELVRRLAQRNALLCLVRNAPAAVARAEVTRRLRRLPGDRVARETALRLPWAMATRASMSRQWVDRPERLWAQWAEQAMTWDVSPARPRRAGP